ncbi:ABC transporter substrate-binding protein [Psychromicrobium xiongbiense]|uniref:ABC transporter substrate-binding protein n=1 Tax=Psychromicrobium xiongbiense TaxID=3051184 RepID=UPI00255506FA|nr:ABC transporter substrate-binding protein [Psychromicrobium sp. YIM S02556]
MRYAKVVAPVLAAGVLAISLTACGGGGSTSASSGGGDAASNLDGRGPITFVQGKDNSNVAQPVVDKWNAAHPDQKVTLKEQTDKADQQHEDLVQNLGAKNPNYDVFSVDVIWTAEFAAKQWLQPLTGKMALDTSAFLAPTVKAATYNKTLYVAPWLSDGGLLFYRKDLVPNPPKTWDEMMGMCSIAKAKGIDCFAGQYAQYEGLTVNASEAINSTGGQVIGDDGKVAIDSDKAKAGLQNLVTAYKNGNIPKQATTYQEEQGRQSFEDGKLLFLRNWPYVYSLAGTDASSKVKDTFGVAPLPGASGPGASTLGGHSLGVSVYSKNKATALDFLKFMTSQEIQKFYVTQASNAPVLSSLYTDPDLVAKLPYLPTLKTSIENAVPRPVTPFYPAVTLAIQQNAFSAINGDKSVDQAVKDMKTAMESAGVK